MAEDAEFWKENKTSKTQKSVELGEDELNNELKTPKPIYKTPTWCKIETVKFLKKETKEKDKKGVEYIPFMMNATFVNLSDGATFTETYGGGRFYAREGGMSIYIGPASALGKLKATCVAQGIDVGNSISSWVTAFTGKNAELSADIVMYEGKKFEKNFITKIK